MPAETVRRSQGLPGVIFGFLGVLAVNLCLAATTTPLGFDDARHLLNRTSFAASPEEIAAFGRLTRREAVDRLLAAAGTSAATPPPEWVGEPFQSLRRLRTMSPEERKLAQREIFQRSFELQSWWLTEMHHHALAARREDDPLLAQPLRVERAEGALAAAHLPAERAPAQPRPGQFRRAAARGLPRPGDARLSRQCGEPQGPAQRELRARADGALYPRRGQLRRARRQGSRARVHWMERGSGYRGVRVPPAGARRRGQDHSRAHGQLRRGRGARHPARRAARRPSSWPASCGASSSRPRPIRRRCGALRGHSASRATTYARRSPRCSHPTRSTRRRTAPRSSSLPSISSSERCASSISRPPKSCRSSSPPTSSARGCSRRPT